MTTAARAAVLLITIVLVAGCGGAVIVLSGGTVPVYSVVSAVLLSGGAVVPTYMLADAVLRRAPDYGPAAVMAGTAGRMGVAVVGVLILGGFVEARGESREGFAVWVAALYVVTLVAESVMLAHRASAVPGTEGTR